VYPDCHVRTRGYTLMTVSSRGPLFSFFYFFFSFLFLFLFSFSFSFSFLLSPMVVEGSLFSIMWSCFGVVVRVSSNNIQSVFFIFPM